MDTLHFMSKALDEANIALQKGEFPVGCILIYKDQVIASGARTGTMEYKNNEMDHAEIIALRKLMEIENNRTIDHNELTLYCTLEPCLMCYGAILINNINNIVYSYEDIMGGGTTINLKSLPELYKNRNVKIISGILRTKSLKLFKEYFSGSDNNYLKDTLLARYTLEQNI